MKHVKMIRLQQCWKTLTAWKSIKNNRQETQMTSYYRSSLLNVRISIINGNLWAHLLLRKTKAKLPQKNHKGSQQVIPVENELICRLCWHFSRTCRGGGDHWSRLCDTVEETGDILEKGKGNKVLIFMLTSHITCYNKQMLFVSSIQ